MEHKFKHSNAEVKTIKSIQFGVIGPEYTAHICAFAECYIIRISYYFAG